MLLAIQIPCFNEEQDLRRALEGIPRVLTGIDRIEIVVIDDGSTDSTVQVARQAGVRHVVRFGRNRGLAKAFSAGINRCLQLGADVIVNMDADNQYPGSEIAKLIAPILDGKAEIVIGDRQVSSLPHFSWPKKRLQKLGSAFVRFLSGTQVPDVVSGFRAYSREAALRINVVSEYSYTIETLMQAGHQRAAIVSVPIAVNPTQRSSRLMKSVPSFIRHMALTMLRSYTMYKPLRTFVLFGALLSLGGFFLFARFLYYTFALNNSSGHVQSLILGAVLLILGFQTVMLGLLGDAMAANRKLTENVLSLLREGKSTGIGNGGEELHGKK